LLRYLMSKRTDFEELGRVEEEGIEIVAGCEDGVAATTGVDLLATEVNTLLLARETSATTSSRSNRPNKKLIEGFHLLMNVVVVDNQSSNLRLQKQMLDEAKPTSITSTLGPIPG
jgi:hypothetical protein